MNECFSDSTRFSWWIHTQALRNGGKGFDYSFDQELRSISYTKGTFGWKRTYKYDYRKSASFELKQLNKLTNKLDGVSCSVTSDVGKKVEVDDERGKKHVTFTREVTITVSAMRAQAEFTSAEAFKNTVLSRHRDIVSRMVDDCLRAHTDPLEEIKVTSSGLEVFYYNQRYGHHKKITFSFRAYGMTGLKTVDEGVGLVLVIISLVALAPYNIIVSPDCNYDDGYLVSVSNNLGSVTIKKTGVRPPLTSWT